MQISYDNDSNFTKIDALQTGDVWALSALPTQAFFTIGTISVDWDGDPRAYGDRTAHPEIRPHDRLAYAGHPGNWWGVVTDNNGIPIEQTGHRPDQPYRNYMISKNILVDNHFGERDVRRWTDATKIPYVALPNSRQSMKNMHLRPGCYCLLIGLRSLKYRFAVYADSKATVARMGEISKRAADSVGSSGEVLIVVFPTSGQGQGIIPNEQFIQDHGRTELANFSGLDKGDQLLRAFEFYPDVGKVLLTAGYKNNQPFRTIPPQNDSQLRRVRSLA